MDILFATNNEHKVKEFRNLFKGHKIILPKEAGINFSYKETGETYFTNAFGKALTLNKISNEPVIADDSGLSVVSLNGGPGVHSARFGSHGSLRLNDSEKNKLLLEQMKNVNDRRAYFVCCMVLLFNKYRFFTSQETVSGLITEKPAGINGFGYDPIFFINEYRKTAAELTDEEKNAVSHRGRASRHILSILNNMQY